MSHDLVKSIMKIRWNSKWVKTLQFELAHQDKEDEDAEEVEFEQE